MHYLQKKKMTITKYIHIIFTVVFLQIASDLYQVFFARCSIYSEAKALRQRVRLHFPAAFIFYFTTKKIKWLIFLLM